MGEKYRTGYVPGVFDLFHIGHLNLLKNSRNCCDQLIVGVLTDELVMHFKGSVPCIPFQERIAIVEAIRYVDQVIPVTKDNTCKIDAWNQLHYDCHFSGDDHGPDWEYDLQQLRAVGSNMEFLSYTKGVSSSARKRVMSGGELEGKLFIFGAGEYGGKLVRFLRDSVESQSKWQIAGFLDNNPLKKGWQIEGITVYQPDALPFIAPDGLFTVVIATKREEDIKKQLEEKGIKKIISYRDLIENIESMV